MNDAFWDVEVFRRQAHDLVDALADHLVSSQSPRQGTPVIASPDPFATRERWRTPPSDDPVQLLKAYMSESTRLHHPRFMGHQVATPVPQAALCEMVSAGLNNAMAVYDMGPVAAAMELAVIDRLAALAGHDETAGGTLTSGGSAGNLTALLAARQVMAAFNVWEEGSHGGPPLAILASEQSHYCVKRAVQIMGLGAEGCIPVPTDADYRLDPKALSASLEHAKRLGRVPFAVVANAASTATGSFDPLDPVADFCQAHRLWMHVDGAHGGSLLWSERHRHKLSGVHRADSFVWDLHKMMAMPALVTAVIYKNGEHAHAPFKEKADYIFEHSAQEEWFNLSRKTLECTRNSMALRAYVALHTMGPRFFADHIDTTHHNASSLAKLIEEDSEFELATSPQTNVVCFRHLPSSHDDPALDFNRSIRAHINNSGRFYIVQVKLRDRWWLRVSLMNPLTTVQDLQDLLDEIKTVARIQHEAGVSHQP